MNRFLFAAALAAASTVAVGCSQLRPAAPSEVPTVAAPAATAVASAQPAVASSAATVIANGQRLSGQVQSFSDGKVTLANGTSFTLAPDARILRAATAQLGELQPGQVVAITGKRQPDNTLLASTINVFPATVSGVPLGQQPLPTGDLMTNATIEQVGPDGLTVKFPQGTAQVKLASGATITKLVDATQTDLKNGVTVTAFVNNGVARSVTIQS